MLIHPVRNTGLFFAALKKRRAKNLVAQSLSALCSACREDFDAIPCGHSLAEAVYLFAVKLFGLVGS